MNVCVGRRRGLCVICLSLYFLNNRCPTNLCRPGYQDTGVKGHKMCIQGTASTSWNYFLRLAIFSKLFCGLMILMNKIDFLRLFIKAHICNGSISVSTSEQVSVPVTTLGDTGRTSPRGWKLSFRNQRPRRHVRLFSSGGTGYTFSLSCHQDFFFFLAAFNRILKKKKKKKMEFHIQNKRDSPTTADADQVSE